MGNVLHRGKGSFTHVENTIFFDHGLSAKAKGIYCQIRSLEGNPEWVFTIKGFASLVRDGADAVTAESRLPPMAPKGPRSLPKHAKRANLPRSEPERENPYLGKPHLGNRHL